MKLRRETFHGINVLLFFYLNWSSVACRILLLTWLCFSSTCIIALLRESRFWSSWTFDSGSIEAYGLNGLGLEGLIIESNLAAVTVVHIIVPGVHTWISAAGRWA